MMEKGKVTYAVAQIRMACEDLRDPRSVALAVRANPE